MTLVKDKGAIKKYSGGVLKILIGTDSGPATTKVAADWLDLGYVQESKLSDSTEEEVINDESGNQVASLEANRVIKFTGLLMQTDKELQDFLTSKGSYTTTGARGNFFAVYHYQGVVNGNHQEMLYPICTIKPIAEVASGVKRIPFEITVLKNETAQPFSKAGSSESSQPELPTGSYAQGLTGGANAIVVAINEYYHVQETAV